MKIRKLVVAATVAATCTVANMPAAHAADPCFPKCQVEGVVTGSGIIPDPSALYIDGTFNGIVIDPATGQGGYRFLRFDVRAELFHDGVQVKGWADFRMYEPSDPTATLMTTQVHLRGQDGAYATEVPLNGDGVAHLTLVRNPVTGFWAGTVAFAPLTL